MRRFNAEVSQIALWDDHEVRDNWYPTERLEADRARREERRPAGGAREARVPRVPAAARQPDRKRADLPRLASGSCARGLRARHAVVPRPELGQPPADADGGVRDPRRRAARVARARAGRVHIHVEGDRVRHAARCRRAGRRRRVRSGREPRARRAARPRARDRATAEGHQGPQNPQRGVADGGRALLRRASLQPGRARASPSSIRSGSSWPDRCTPAPSARASSIGRSVPR